MLESSVFIMPVWETSPLNEDLRMCDALGTPGVMAAEMAMGGGVVLEEVEEEEEEENAVVTRGSCSM